MTHPFWRKTVFDIVLWACGLFALLTVLAMFFYPGGTFSDPATIGYSFFENFFSDLGMTVSHAGQPNPIANSLFTLALTLVGIGLMLFFAAFPQFFWRHAGAKKLSLIGSAIGIAAGVCFIGVAFTPHNLYLDAHTEFVMWAFRLFPLAVLCYTVAMRQVGTPRRHQMIFVVFFGLLVAYMLLLEFGPGVDTYSGMLIQAVGQKIIVYASIASVMAQAFGARNNKLN
ncbi:MAG: hypothetical protein CVU44_19055 [Chloroflexi bacterium HGW-Chloroflexi-6]|nr:MAG: hypothetical protein CVU44_19055 [Chloroflexi bacterium HGW-Chloroflexi-6]